MTNNSALSPEIERVSKLAYSNDFPKFRAGDMGFSKLEKTVKTRIEQEFPDADLLTRRAITKLIVGNLIMTNMRNNSI